MDTASSISAVHPLNSSIGRRTPGSADDAAANLPGRPSASGGATDVSQSQTLRPVEAAPDPSTAGYDGGEHSPEKDQQVAHAVKNINDFFQMVRRRLEFTMNDDSGRMIIQIRDTETNEVVRQIPSEEVLQLAKRLDEFKGLLFHDKV